MVSKVLVCFVSVLANLPWLSLEGQGEGSTFQELGAYDGGRVTFFATHARLLWRRLKEHKSASRV